MNNNCGHLWSDSPLLFTHDYISDEKHWWINHPTCDPKNCYPWQAMSYPLYQPLFNTGPIFCHYIFRPGPRMVGINFYGIQLCLSMSNVTSDPSNWWIFLTFTNDIVDSLHGNKNVVRLTDLLSPAGIDVCISDTFSVVRLTDLLSPGGIDVCISDTFSVVRLTDLLSPGGIDVCISDTFSVVRLTDLLSPGGIDVCISDTFSVVRLTDLLSTGALMSA